MTRVKTITARNIQVLEQLINSFLANLGKDEELIDIKYANCLSTAYIVHNALIIYRIVE